MVPFSLQTAQVEEEANGIDETDGASTKNTGLSHLEMIWNHLAGIDDVSMDLSVDWTPPPSHRASRRNTAFSLNIPSIRLF